MKRMMECQIEVTSKVENEEEKNTNRWYRNVHSKQMGFDA